jgi:hypothetical protein
MSLTTERTLPTLFPNAKATPAFAGESAVVPRSQSARLGVRKSINPLGVFPPEVQLAMKIDKNFSVGVDSATGTHYLVIDPELIRKNPGMRVNIYA